MISFFFPAKEYYQLNQEVLKNSEYQKQVDQWNKEFNIKINEKVYNQIKVTE
jgi:SOS-response transcriptional repressor LexA